MTPQERQLIDGLFDKLASLEQAPRDADANAAITAGLRRAPNATYALVQTVLLQDEALKRANDRIQELEAGNQPQPQGGFLDSMRDTLFGGNNGSRGSVPNVRPGDGARGPQWNSGQVLGQGQQMQGQQPGYGQPPFGGAPQTQSGGGGSFLGTAAAAAAGVIGGSLLMNSIRGLMGGSQHGFGDQASLGKSESASPWGGSGNGSNDLARDAGINDIGKNSGSNDQRQSFADQQSDTNDRYDTANNDDDDDDFDDDDGDFDMGGDSDYA